MSWSSSKIIEIIENFAKKNWAFPHAIYHLILVLNFWIFAEIKKFLFETNVRGKKLHFYSSKIDMGEEIDQR
jgi:hypothetical protein